MYDAVRSLTNGPTEPPRIDRMLAPFRTFSRTAAAGGILLFLATVVALVWANSPWSDSYARLWSTELSIEAGRFHLDATLSHWINDGLMVIFFFVVGLEIKREVLVGELASLRQAAFPIAAAIGGATVPALIFLAFNAGTEAVRGWGVPMATDIAFALGVLALLGSRVPNGLKVFLAALAIADDLIAVLVIAIAYTETVAWIYLGAGFVVLCAAFILNWLGVIRPIVYAVLGIVLWLVFLKSGVHATIAGVLLAMAIPARTRIDTFDFVARGRALLSDIESAATPGVSVVTNRDHQSALHELETTTEFVQSPMQRMEYGLHPWVAFLIVPLFALANAGVPLDSGLGEALTSPSGLGVIIGLVIGKQVGITLSALAMVRFGIAPLPDGVTMRQIYAVSWVAGIGFTMSLFIAELAFDGGEHLAAIKAAVLVASAIAGTVGYLLMRLATQPTPAES
ncbi:MAG: Na+/H+ antiporter NhaA [Thermomicrobiales bacterium]|nr:Na+/H+ antiporter NhaA [Thermomicrobiales bacterium]